MDHDHSDPQVVVVTAEIRRYLQRHPEAADTLDGIGRWWLMQQVGPLAWKTIQQALDKLVIEGVLKKTYTPDGRVIYSSARSDFDQRR